MRPTSPINRYYGVNATRLLTLRAHLGWRPPGPGQRGASIAAQPERRRHYSAGDIITTPRSTTVPHTFTAHPDHPAVAYLARLHADLGGQLRANKLQATKLANEMRAA